MTSRTKVVVMCHANKYRSPLAAAFLAQHKWLDVRQAGFLRSGAMAGRPVREAAKRFGFNLEDHRSREIDDGLLAWADFVIVMNPKQLQKINERIRPYKPGQRVVLLGAYLEHIEQSIPDLAFINVRDPEFERVVSMIKDATGKFAQCLKPTTSES